MYKSVWKTSSLLGLVLPVVVQILVIGLSEVSSVTHSSANNRSPEQTVVVSSSNKPTANLVAAAVSVPGPDSPGQPVVERPPILQQTDPPATQEASAKDAPSASSEPTWIERLLIRVDGLSSGPGLSWLDSADDGSAGGGQVSMEEPTTETQAASSSVGWDNVSSHGDLSEEDLIVETNNVSAVLAHASINSQPLNNPQVITTSATRTPISCERAYTQCALRKACAPALRSFNDLCHELINNRANASSGATCSGRCLRAMIALRSSDEGEDLVGCDCQGDDYCLHTKQRSASCLPQVDDALKPGTVVSCSTATAICMADQSCSEALKHYYRNCGNSLFSHSHCSTKCNNSLAILHRQPKASKIISCYCDGSEEFPCTKYKAYTERLCLNKAGASYLSASVAASSRPEDDSFRHLNSAQASQQESANGSIHREADNEENVATEPVSSNNHSGEEGEDGSDEEDADEAEYEEDAKSGDSSQDELPAEAADSSNQLWIPLLGARYFADLHRQQLRLQQMERQQRQLHKHHLNQQVVAGSGGHKQQKTTLKQNSTSAERPPPQQHTTRRRHRRILMLASASPSAHSLDGWPLTPVVVVVAIVSVVVAVVAALFKSLVSRPRQAV